jgi:hypothetical protein
VFLAADELGAGNGYTSKFLGGYPMKGMLNVIVLSFTSLILLTSGVDFLVSIAYTPVYI